MLRRSNAADAVLTLLGACPSMAELKRIHAVILTVGLWQDARLASQIIYLAASSDTDDLPYSQRFFHQLPNPTVFNWNSLIRGYARSRNPNRAVSTFVRMLRGGVLPDNLTYPFLLKASALLPERRLVVVAHGHVFRTGFVEDRFIENSLIHAYGACRDVPGARKVFDEMTQRNLVSWNSMLDAYGKSGDVNSGRKLFESMPERDVVSWSSMIDGHVKNGDHVEALAMFDRMKEEGMRCNEVTMVSVLSACAHMGALDQGRLMHQYLKENALPLNLVLLTSLVDMYAKCGAISEAVSTFRQFGGRKTDVLLWNSIIGGVSMHGSVKEALDLFSEMKEKEVCPDEITYLCLLSACAHGGFLNEAWYFFRCLTEDGLMPKMEHYACMVDVLSRAGQLTEAYRFLCVLPTEPTASMLGSLLSGCLNRRELDLAELVGKKLVQLEPDHDGRYVGLSNAYAVLNRWDDARTTRRTMEMRGVKKSPAYSSIEIHHILHTFIANDKNHKSSLQIHWMLSFLFEQLKGDTAAA